MFVCLSHSRIEQNSMDNCGCLHAGAVPPFSEVRQAGERCVTRYLFKTELCVRTSCWCNFGGFVLKNWLRCFLFALSAMATRYRYLAIATRLALCLQGRIQAWADRPPSHWPKEGGGHGCQKQSVSYTVASEHLNLLLLAPLFCMTVERGLSVSGGFVVPSPDIPTWNTALELHWGSASGPPLQVRSDPSNPGSVPVCLPSLAFVIHYWLVMCDLRKLTDVVFFDRRWSYHPASRDD